MYNTEKVESESGSPFEETPEDPDAPVERTYAPGVDILDSILSGINDSVEGKWYWKRKGIHVRFRALEHEEFSAFNKRHTIQRRIKRTQIIHTDLENEAFNIDVVAQTCLDIDFMNPSVRQKIATAAGRSGQNTVADAVKTVFLIGEIATAAGFVLQDLSGFDNETEEEGIKSLKD